MESFCNDPKCEMIKMGIYHNPSEHSKISYLKEIESRNTKKMILLISGFVLGIIVIFYLITDSEVDIENLFTIIAVGGWIIFEIWGNMD